MCAGPGLAEMGISKVEMDRRKEGYLLEKRGLRNRSPLAVSKFHNDLLGEG